MCGAIPALLLYVFMAWYLGNHRDNFTSYFFIHFKIKYYNSENKNGEVHGEYR
jgi:hypothetical protein